jgi:hypothetical protein
MRMRGLPLVILLAVSPAAAADCAKLIDSHTSLSGSGTQKLGDDAPVALALSIERPGHTIVVIHKDGASQDTRSEYDRQMLVAASAAGGVGALSFRLEPGNGDPWSLDAGSSATYRQGVLRDGELGGVEIVVQSVAARQKHTISGCEIEIVPIRREIGLLGGASQRLSQIDYAPALGFPLRIVTEFTGRAGQQRIETEIDSLEAK